MTWLPEDHWFEDDDDEPLVQPDAPIHQADPRYAGLDLHPNDEENHP